MKRGNEVPVRHTAEFRLHRYGEGAGCKVKPTRAGPGRGSGQRVDPSYSSEVATPSAKMSISFDLPMILYKV